MLVNLLIQSELSAQQASSDDTVAPIVAPALLVDSDHHWGRRSRSRQHQRSHQRADFGGWHDASDVEHVDASVGSAMYLEVGRPDDRHGGLQRLHAGEAAPRRGEQLRLTE